MIPTTIKDFVITKLTKLSSVTRLVVVFDPYADLDLGDTLSIKDSSPMKPDKEGFIPGVWRGEESGGTPPTPPAPSAAPTSSGRTWRVLHYDGNDLAFRKQQNQQPGQSDLVWVTAPPGLDRDLGTRIQLQSMMDVWQRSEAFIDASLPGILRQLAPGETWPEAAIWDQADILSQNLPTVIKGWQELRPNLKQPISLDKHIIRTLALHCQQPHIPIGQLLFQVDTLTRILDTYLDLLWRTEWSSVGLTLLQKQAHDAPRLEQRADIEAWLNIPPSTLALYIYLRRCLGNFKVPNITNQLRGLGLFQVETDILEAQVGRILERWNEDSAWRYQVIRQAEATLTVEDINRVIELLGLDTPLAVAEAFALADTPATLYALQVKFFTLAFETKGAYKHTLYWIEHRPYILGNLPDTEFKDQVLHLAMFLDEISFIDTRLPLILPKQRDIARLLDWYIKHKLYDLEYAHARAGNELLFITDEKLQNQFKEYLKWQKKIIGQYLDQLDHALADLITPDWGSYLSHPRLATNVLNDLVKRRRIKIDKQTRLWVVVFDGMRWDTWAKHVKPRLLETYELVETEKAYLSLLPSWTGIARTGLLAGRLPGDWKSYWHNPTRNQAQLAAKLFNIPQREQSKQLQFYSTMESDRKYSQAQSNTRYPYNILVYNISDDNLHSQQSSLAELNKVVNTLLETILQSLKNMVEPEDTLIISSDHGFVELDEADAIVVPDDQRWERYQRGEAHLVRYRYLTTHEIPADLSPVLKVAYRGFDSEYTVAIGQRWFKRADSRGREDRYAHGGLSLAEMVVPGAILKRITTKQIKPVLSARPAKLELQEKETKELTVLVANEGNISVIGKLTIQANSATEPIVYNIELQPGENQQVSYNVYGDYRSDGNSTERVDITLVYQNIEGREKKRSKQVPVKVNKRTDVVELDFGGLADLDI